MFAELGHPSAKFLECYLKLYCPLQLIFMQNGTIIDMLIIIPRIIFHRRQPNLVKRAWALISDGHGLEFQLYRG